MSSDAPPTDRYPSRRRSPQDHSEHSGDHRRKRPCVENRPARGSIMTEFALDAVCFRGPYWIHANAPPVRVPDVRNFISPPWPRRFWAQPVFTKDSVDLETSLAASVARNTAAAAAIDNLKAAVDGNLDSLSARLDPLEARAAQTADALAELERAAAAAEEADAAAPPPRDVSFRSAVDGDVPGGAAAADDRVREVQVAKNDPRLRYDTDLQKDMLAVVYAARGLSGSSGVSMGTWYRTMQETLVAERPTAARRIDYQNGRISRTFVAAVVASMQAAGRAYVGARQYTAFEAATLCLYAYSAATSGAGAVRPPGSFSGALSDLGVYLDEMAETVSSSGGRPKYSFESPSLPKTTFAAQGAGRYERDALTGHSVLSALTTTRTLPAPPGAIPKEGVSAAVDAEGTAYDDRVNNAAAALLGRAQTLFLMEDQTLLRLAVDTITGLLLLRRLLWNTNVYGDPTLNSFQLGAILPGGASTAVGASGSAPRDAIKSDGRNLDFLIRNYVRPLYENDRSVELTQMFPGLVAVCLEAAFGGLGGQSRGTRRRVLDVSSGRGQAALLKLVALELENRGKSNVASVREVIETHDAVALQYEKGLGACMQTLRPREALFQSGKAAAFNVSTDYDALYFLCFGFLPKFTSAQ